MSFYTSLKGFQEIEVPWMVHEDFNRLTMPPGAILANINSDPSMSLVGSAEQSLLAMKDGLEDKIYVAFSPCFRLGDSDGGLHVPTFLKIELGSPNPKRWREIMLAAKTFFLLRTDCVEPIERKIDDFQTDLELGGIEIGSYGYRPSLGWAYGTGLAEPRFSMAKDALLNPRNDLT